MTYTDMPLAELLAGTSRAKAVYPLERLRIEKGLGLCLHEAVELRIDGGMSRSVWFTDVSSLVSELNGRRGGT